MRKILFIALILIAGIWLIVGGSGCTVIKKYTGRDTVITSWKHFVPVDVAKKMINRLAAIDSNGIIHKSQLAQSHLYGEAKTMMRNMMLRDDCVGMRIYYGLTPENKIIPLVCGVTRNGSDIYWRRPAGQAPGARLTADTMPAEEGLCDMSRPEPPPPSNAIYLGHDL